MKLIDTIELLTEILVGKKEETRSQKKIRTTDVKTKGKTAKKTKWDASGSDKVELNEKFRGIFTLDWVFWNVLYVGFIISWPKQRWNTNSFYCMYDT